MSSPRSNDPTARWPRICRLAGCHDDAAEPRKVLWAPYPTNQRRAGRPHQDGPQVWTWVICRPSQMATAVFPGESSSAGGHPPRRTCSSASPWFPKGENRESGLQPIEDPPYFPPRRISRVEGLWFTRWLRRWAEHLFPPGSRPLAASTSAAALGIGVDSGVRLLGICGFIAYRLWLGGRSAEERSGGGEMSGWACRAGGTMARLSSDERAASSGSMQQQPQSGAVLLIQSSAGYGRKGQKMLLSGSKEKEKYFSRICKPCFPIRVGMLLLALASAAVLAIISTGFRRCKAFTTTFLFLWSYLTRFPICPFILETW